MRRTLYETEHEAFRESFRRFLQAEFVPHLDEWDAAGIVSRELYTAAGKAGFLAIDAPEEFGGGGVPDFRFNAVIMEEIMRTGGAGAGLGLTLHNDVCLPYFLEYCTEEQKSRWLPGIASGELITAIAMTEPGAGSDLAGITTTARRDGDAYVVNGAKTFITNGINADLVVTAVKTDPGARHAGMSLLVLERGMAGFTRGRNPRQARPARPGHRRAGVHRRAGAGREPPRCRGGARLHAAGHEPAAGTAVDRARRGRRGPRGA